MPLSRHRHNLFLLVGYGSFRIQDKLCIVGLLDPLWIGARCVPKREREQGVDMVSHSGVAHTTVRTGSLVAA
jgi:hypothetical protein